MYGPIHDPPLHQFLAIVLRQVEKLLSDRKVAFHTLRDPTYSWHVATRGLLHCFSPFYSRRLLRLIQSGLLRACPPPLARLCYASLQSNQTLLQISQMQFICQPSCATLMTESGRLALVTSRRRNLPYIPTIAMLRLFAILLPELESFPISPSAVP